MENKFNLDEKLDEFVKEEKRGTTQKVEQKVNYKNANRGKKKNWPVRLTVFGAAAVLVFVGYKIHDREPEIDLENSKVIDSVSDEKSIDEVMGLYDAELTSKYGDDERESSLGNILSKETDLSAAIDTIETLTKLSNELDEFELEKIVEDGDGLRKLTKEEELAVESLTVSDLEEKMAHFGEKSNVDYKEFSQEAIEYNREAMDLKYAKDLINSQLLREGKSFLADYGDLIIQSIIIDKTNLPVEEYDDIEIKVNDNRYSLKYTAETTGQHFTVNIDDNDVREILTSSDYFDSTIDKKVNFKDYKKKTLKAINVYKKALLSTYELDKEYSDAWSLSNESTNSEIREKVKSLS